MALVRWDPTRDLDVLQTDMNRLFDAFFQGRGGNRGASGEVQRWVPPMDLTEVEGEYVLRADLPGLTKDDIEIEVKDGVLSISGERKSEHHENGEGFYRIERSFGRFSRSLDLPAGVDAASVAAEFDNGVLEVRIPKPEERQPARVQIGAGNGKAGE
ncbi:MAG TPA: Hsp20/alpha crystallin family protein [Solirubrobacterales bacterium]|nr:Hsp20/alpha crystallin family protein [Solirubrobacterales bacterium]